MYVCSETFMQVHKMSERQRWKTMLQIKAAINASSKNLYASSENIYASTIENIYASTIENIYASSKTIYASSTLTCYFSWQ